MGEYLKNAEPKSAERNALNHKLLGDYRFRVIVVILLCVIFLSGWMTYSHNREKTDNAIVRCDLIDLVSEVNGVIDGLFFEDNQYFNKGDYLVKIEDKLFQADVNEAQAQLNFVRHSYEAAVEKKKIAEISSIGNAEALKASSQASRSILNSNEFDEREIQAELVAKNSDLKFLESKFNRISYLYKNSMVSKLDYEESEKLYNVAVAQRDTFVARLAAIRSKRETKGFNTLELTTRSDIAAKSMNALIAAADAEVRIALSQVELAEAKLKLAKIRYDKTNIKALITGVITNRRVSTGEYVEIGQPIASITSCGENAWVEANFKETQIGRITAGQEVDIQIDTYPNQVFKGKIKGVSSGSGATFSVLPPENAVGNFTKVVQRFPVKISIENDNKSLFRAGMSSVVTVKLD